MNKAISESIFEIKEFGLNEYLNHLLYKTEIGNKYKSKFLYVSYRDKVLKQLNQEQMAALLKKMFLFWQGVDLDYKNPIHFTEKIQYLKIYDNSEIKRQLVDKYRVRTWIEDKIGKQYLIPLIGVWDSFEKIDFSKMPDKFCLKANHGSGMNIVVKDKEKLNFDMAKNMFNWWLKTPFWAMALEMQYRDIEPRIVAEKYIEEMDGSLNDYKIHCFNGKPTFIQCIGDRDVLKHTGYQKHYNLEWEDLGWTFADYPDFPSQVKKPDCLDEMIAIAKILSNGFVYVRVDLYEIKGKIYFGEMTFTPACGVYPYKDRWTEERDIKLGKMIKLEI